MIVVKLVILVSCRPMSRAFKSIALARLDTYHTKAPVWNRIPTRKEIDTLLSFILLSKPRTKI